MSPLVYQKGASIRMQPRLVHQSGTCWNRLFEGLESTFLHSFVQSFYKKSVMAF
jgi:hypothetical protein